LAFWNLNSIAKEIKVVDYMLKAADSTLTITRASYPEKCYFMICEQLTVIERSIEVGV
jgi:microcompartment protein CcmL/EutN